MTKRTYSDAFEGQPAPGYGTPTTPNNLQVGNGQAGGALIIGTPIAAAQSPLSPQLGFTTPPLVAQNVIIHAPGAPAHNQQYNQFIAPPIQLAFGTPSIAAQDGYITPNSPNVVIHIPGAPVVTAQHNQAPITPVQLDFGTSNSTGFESPTSSNEENSFTSPQQAKPAPQAPTTGETEIVETPVARPGGGNNYWKPWKNPTPGSASTATTVLVESPKQNSNSEQSSIELSPGEQIILWNSFQATPPGTTETISVEGLHSLENIGRDVFSDDGSTSSEGGSNNLSHDLNQEEKMTPEELEEYQRTEGSDTFSLFGEDSGL